MSRARHSYVEFYPSDWIAGTARMTRMQRSIYFDICCYCWDKGEECPAAELPLLLGDIDNWASTLDVLVAAGKLYRRDDGGIGNARAIDQARKAFDLWQRKSIGGRIGAGKTNSAVTTPDMTPAESGAPLPSQNQNQNQNQNHIGDAQSAPAKPKRERKDSSALPDDCPSETDRAAAVQYWRDRGRVDLCARLSDEVSAFRAHHLAHGKRMADWGAAWRTWYGNAIRFNPQRAGKGAAAPAVATEHTNEAGWRKRLQASRDREGAWPASWGPRPGEPGCVVPAHLITEAA